MRGWGFLGPVHQVKGRVCHSRNILQPFYNTEVTDLISPMYYETVPGNRYKNDEGDIAL